MEPDVFHDFFGHVPMLFDPVFADYMQAYGRGGLKADGCGALERLARLYWYTVEFGLDPHAGRDCASTGRGSCPPRARSTTRSASPKPRPHGLRPEAGHAHALYRIDTFQETYFVIESFDQLFEATRPDFAPLYLELATLPELPANAVLPEDREVS